MPLKKGSAVLASIEATVTRARAAKHKKIQAQVNKHLEKAKDTRFDRGGASLKHTAAALKAKAQLPQGYAMVFGKLRKITAGKRRPNRLSPK